MNQKRIIETIRQHPLLVATEDFEIGVRQWVSKTKRHRAGAVVSESCQEQSVVQLRILHRKRPGISAVTRTDSNTLAQLVEQAFLSFESSREDPWFRFPMWKKVDIIQTKIPTWSGPARDFQEFASDKNGDFSFTENIGDTTLVRKSEKPIRESHLHWQSYRARYLVSGNGYLFNLTDQVEFNGSVPSLMPRFGILGQYLSSLTSGVEKIDTIRGKVVFSPLAAATLLSFIAPWFKADLVQNGDSPLSKAKDIFSPALSITEDGTLLWGRMRPSFDSEGAVFQRNPLVMQGRVQSLLYDALHGAKANRITTGNLLYVDDELFPKIGSAALYIEPSEIAPAELHSRLDSGPCVDFVETVENSHSDNPVVKFYGRLIQKGKPVTAFVSNPMEISLLTLWKQVLAVGNDTAFQGGVGSPSIFFEKIP